METVKEKLECALMKMGMFESQAKEVIDLAIPKLQELAGDYKITFNNSSDSYPNGLYAVWFITIKPIALKWIEENKPQAWFKPMFQ